MNVLLYALFASLFSVEWLAFSVKAAGRVLTWIPEILSLIAMVLVFVVAALRREIDLPYRYGVFLAAFLMITLGWSVVSGVPSGVLLAGTRSYLKYLPFFLLPLVYPFRETDIRRQLLFLLGLSMLQMPLAVYQRFIRFADLRTGDVVGGTLGANASGILSVYLACAIAVVVAFYLKGRIGAKILVLLASVLAMPMMLNETKVSIALLPAAIVGPIVLAGGSGTGANARKAMALAVLGIVLSAAFLNMYQALRGTSLIDFFATKGKVERHLAPGKNPRFDDITNRFDSIRLAVRQLDHDGNLLLGVGVGNASISFSDKLTGEYYKKYEYLSPGLVYLSKVLWELGIVGVLVYGTLFGLLSHDAFRMRRRSDIVGPLALGWVLVSGFIAGSFAYFKTFDVNLFGYLYWYFAGYLVSEVYRQRQRELNHATEEGDAKTRYAEAAWREVQGQRADLKERVKGRERGWVEAGSDKLGSR